MKDSTSSSSKGFSIYQSGRGYSRYDSRGYKGNKSSRGRSSSNFADLNLTSPILALFVKYVASLITLRLNVSIGLIQFFIFLLHLLQIHLLLHCLIRLRPMLLLFQKLPPLRFQPHGSWILQPRITLHMIFIS